MTTFDIDIRVRHKSEGDGLDDTDKKLGRLQGAFQKLVAGGLIAAASKQLFEFGKESLNLASDVQEMQSKFDIVFANFGDEVSSSLDEFAKAAGRSSNELKGMASTLGDTLKPLGFTEEKAADFSVQLTQLATDLSSFNNLPMDDALRRLQGTLIGSHENALAFGVVINENTLKAELAANGWDKLTGSQLEAAKVQARINLLMAGTTDAQGDAIRTSEGYANQQRALSAAFDDLRVSIGRGLIEPATEATSVIKELTSATANWIGTNHDINQAVKDGIITQAEANRLIDKIALTSYTAADAQDLLAQKYDSAARASENELRALQPLIAQAESYDRVLTGNTGTISDATAATLELTDAEKELEDQIAFNLAVAKDNAQANEETVITVEMLAEAEQKRVEIEQEAAEAARLLAEETARLAEQSGDLFTRFAEGNAPTETMGQSLLRMADQGGASAEQLALLAIATGELTEAEANALIQQVALEQSLAALGEQYAQGNLSIEEYVASANKAVEEISNLTVATSEAEEKTNSMGAAALQTADLLETEKSHVITLIEEINKIPPDVKSNVKVEGVDAANSAVGRLIEQLNRVGQANIASAIESGEATARDTGDVGMAGGGSFVVPPGFPNDSYPLFPGIRAESGETVTVTPRGQNNGQMTIIENVNLHIQALPGISAPAQAREAANEFLNTLGSG